MDILTHIDSLPTELKFYIYGFIHIDNRIAIMTTQYKELIDGSQRSDKYMNLNRSFKYFSIDTIHKFEKISSSLPVSLGCSIDKSKFQNNFAFLNRKQIFKDFPRLPSTTYRVNNRVRTSQHPFISNVINCLPSIEIIQNRSPERLKNAGLLVTNNLMSNLFLLESESFNLDFDRVFKQKIFKFLLTFSVLLTVKNVSNDIKHAKSEIKLQDFIWMLEKNEKKIQAKERKLMGKEEKLSQIQENWKERQRAKKIAQLEKEANERKMKRIAIRNEKELQKQKEKQIRIEQIKLRKQQILKNKEIKHKKKLQLEEDKIFLNNFKSLFAKPKLTILEKQNKKEKLLKERQEKKSLKEKLLREKHYDRLDKEICKAMQQMFKPVRITKKTAVL